MYNYSKSQYSPYDPKRLAVHFILGPEIDVISNCRKNLKKAVSFDDKIHFIDEQNIATFEDFDCGITFYPEAPTTVKQIIRERKNFSKSCENWNWIPINDQNNCFIDEEHTSNTFLKPYNLLDIDPAVFMSLNHTPDILIAFYVQSASSPKSSP